MEITQPAGAGVEAQPVLDATVATAEAQVADDTAQPEVEAEHVTEAKKLQNALAKRKRDIGRLTAQKYQAMGENAQLKARLAELEGTKSDTASDAPKEEQFANYTEYLQAISRYEARQELSKGQKEAEANRTKAEKQVWREERETNISDDAEKARELFPDFNQVLSEHRDIFASLPPHIEEAFLESDKPCHAFYSMAKDGSLETLLLAPTASRAAALIAKAEERALAQSKTKPVTNAPTPLAASKGTAAGRKPIEAMSGKELMSWIKS